MSIDLNYLKIETFTGINDAPVAPTNSKAGNGSHLIKQFNDLVTEVDSIFNSITPDHQRAVLLSSNYPGGFEASGSIEEKYLACGIGSNSAFKIIFPTDTKHFMSQWGIDINSSNDESLTLDLVGKFPTESLIYRWDGTFPNEFGVHWYRGAKFADGLDLNVVEADRLNLSIVNSNKELHIYNTTEHWIDLLARVTYSIVFQVD